MADIVMPRLSDTMEEGTILHWLKHDGEEIRRGEELVEIETDKAAMTYESDQDGTLQTVAAEGDTLPVGELIARVGVPGDGVAAGGGGAHAGDRATAGGDRTAGAEVTRSDGARAVDDATAHEADVAAGAAGPDRPVMSPPEQVEEPTSASPAADGGGRVKASPLARRIARENDIDLRSLSGSGPGGRIVKADVEAAGDGPADAGDGGAAAPSAPSSAARSAPTAGASGVEAAASQDVRTAKGQMTTEPLTRMQQTIARRMAESKATIPDFALQADVDMEECVRLRGELKRISSQDAPTYNDMVVKAAALALREHPRANGSYKDAALQLHSRVNVGVAVAAQDALVVPTVFDADVKALGEIARETRALAGRVREATITPPELGGGTFTVSNLGMYGIKSFTAIINPPQAAILSVGAVEQRPVVRDGELLARHTMTLTLVCDHRILYGADAAEFLARIRELLQAPASLTL
jgi:pyruvate dehydrogenase E2 component (dihydrolipoamide acetyltransferase)